MSHNLAVRPLFDASTGETTHHPLTELVDAMPAIQLPDGVWIVPLQLEERDHG